MEFVDKLPGRSSRRSRFDEMIGPSDIEQLKKYPGRWALIAEDKPRGWQSNFSAWGNRKGLRTATRATIPGGTEIDLYVSWPGTEETV